MIRSSMDVQALTVSGCKKSKIVLSGLRSLITSPGGRSAGLILVNAVRLMQGGTDYNRNAPLQRGEGAQGGRGGFRTG